MRYVYGSQTASSAVALAAGNDWLANAPLGQSQSDFFFVVVFAVLLLCGLQPVQRYQRDSKAAALGDNDSAEQRHSGREADQHNAHTQTNRDTQRGRSAHHTPAIRPSAHHTPL